RQPLPARVGLPEGAVALEYAVLPSGVHLWATAAGRREHFALTTSRSDLAGLVNAFRTAIQNRVPKEQIASASTRLFEAVCGPAAGLIAAATRLVIVPDGPLKGLPFAGLVAPHTGRPLIASLSIVVTPSLTYYAERGERPRAARHQMLAIGNPDRAAAADRSLSLLPGAEQEARAVAAIYPSSRLLTGSTATPGSFLRDAADSSIVPFAGHAIVDDRRPDLSRLLLAASADDPVGAVFATDLSRTRFGNVSLVVLSACETAGGPVNRVEGVVGLARAFLSAGVGSV